MIKRAADEGREPRSSRGCDRDRRHDLCERLAVEQIPGDGARQHGERTCAGSLYRSADQQTQQIARERAPHRSEHENAEPDQDRHLPPQPVRQRADNQLSDGKDRQKNRDGRSDGRAGYAQIGRDRRQRGQKDIGRQDSRGGERANYRSAGRCRSLPGFCGRRLAQNDFNAHGLRVPCLMSKRSDIGCLIACAATALPAGRLRILNNCLLGVVLGMLEEALDRQRRGVALCRCATPAVRQRIKRLRSVTIPVALSQPAASHILQRA